MRKGFDPDPVKKWRDMVKKKELEMTGETQVEEDEIETENAEEVNCCSNTCLLQYVDFSVKRKLVFFSRTQLYHLHQ